MKNISLIKRLGCNFALLVITGFSVLTLSACGGSSSSSTPTPSPSASPSADVATAITIDNAGVVPVFAGTSTTSVIYVHNNSNATISNITYTAKDNNADNTSTSNKLLQKAKKLFGFKAQVGSGSSLNTASAQLCGTIPAGQSCPLSFTVPSTATANVQGSLLITATYNNSTVFSQVISYQQIVNQSDGAQFNSGVNISGFGNKIGYGTVYLYGSGYNQIYKIGTITSDKTAVTVSQGDISGQQLASNAIQAVEVMAIMGTSTSFNTKLSISSTDMTSGNAFMSHALLAVNASSNGAILTTGQVPLVNTAVASPSGQLYIVNSGNSTATIGSISYPSNVSASTGSGACGSTLAAGAGCTVYFTFTNQSNGSGLITVNYTGGVTSSLSQNITWYNGTGSPLLTMSTNTSPIIFQDAGPSSTGTATITLYNIGGFNMTSFTPANPTAITGSATGSASGTSCHAGGSSLPIGESCSYTISVSDSTAETGYLKLSVTASYVDANESAQTYTRLLVVPYTSLATPTTLTVTGNSALSIIGNNIESQTDTLVVTNSGYTSATITSSALSSNPSSMTITSNGCSGQTLTPSQTCNVVVRLGPTTASTTTSGTAVYSVTYNSDGSTGLASSANIAYTVQSNVQSIDLITVTPSGSITGSGSSGSPYIVDGYVTSTQSMTLTYRNTGTNPIIITGISNTNSPMSWLMESGSSTTCFPNSSNSSTIAVNGTCNVIFYNVLYLYTAAVSGLGSSYTENLTVPQLTFKDTNATPTQFQVTPTLPSPLSGTTLYVTGHQATITNSASLSGSVVTVGSALTNATNYSTITVTSNMEDYFTGSPSLTNCTQTSESGVIRQICTLAPSGGTASASGAYTRNSTYGAATLNVLFNSSTSGQAVAMSPLAIQVTLP